MHPFNNVFQGGNTGQLGHILAVPTWRGGDLALPLFDFVGVNLFFFFGFNGWVNDNGFKWVFSSCDHGPNDKCSFGKVVARMSGQDGLLLSEEQLWAAFRDAHKCFQVEIFQIFR